MCRGSRIALCLVWHTVCFERGRGRVALWILSIVVMCRCPSIMAPSVLFALLACRDAVRGYAVLFLLCLPTASVLSIDRSRSLC